MQPDDPSIESLDSSRMPLGEHIEELRRRLWRAILGYAVAVVLGFLVSRPVFDLIAGPIEQALDDFYARRLESQQRKLDGGDRRLTQANLPREMTVEASKADLLRALGLPAGDESDEWLWLRIRVRPVDFYLATGPAHNAVLRPGRLTALTVTEPFTVYFKVSLMLGLVLESPWIFYQLWGFVAAGMYRRERRLVYFYGPISLGLFLGGVVLCQAAVLPAGVSYLLSYYEWLDVEPGLRLNDWLHFALWMPVVFGLAFQTPLVMLVLERIGVFSVATYRSNRRLAIFLLALLAAVLTVSPDWWNMMALAVPLWLLYEVGILLCRLSARAEPAEEPGEEGVADGWV